MIYTDSGRYAIRAMTFIASQDDTAQPVAAADVAAAEEIPPFYMAKVLQDLGRAGILKSLRGRGGGFTMTRPADKIPVMEVLEAVEDTQRIRLDCVLGLDECNDTVSCPMHRTWKRFRESLLARVNDMTVKDLVVELKRKRRYTKRK
jgi:Rrf2 family protein